MSDDQRHKAEFEVHSCGEEHEQQHERNAGDYLRVDDRHVCDVHNYRLGDLAHGVDPDSGEGPEQRSRNAGYYGDYDGVHQRGDDDLVAEQLRVPVERESAEHGTALGLVEREHDKHEDRHVQEHKNKSHVHF